MKIRILDTMYTVGKEAFKDKVFEATCENECYIITNKDLTDQGIELGSPGKEYNDDFKWHFGVYSIVEEVCDEG